MSPIVRHSLRNISPRHRRRIEVFGEGLGEDFFYKKVLSVPLA